MKRSRTYSFLERFAVPRLAASLALSAAVSIGLCLAGTTGVAAPQQAPEKKAEAPKAIAALAWLAGGVWTADASKMGGDVRIETRYQWADNNAFLRFNTHFVTGKGTLKNYDGNLFWDAEKNSYAIWYMDAGNAIIAGPMTWDGTVLKVTFRGHDFEGKMADLKVDVTRVSNDHYHWAVAEKEGDVYKELATLEYLRAGGA